jgi:hypothetical protein
MKNAVVANTVEVMQAEEFVERLHDLTYDTLKTW